MTLQSATNASVTMKLNQHLSDTPSEHFNSHEGQVYCRAVVL